MTDASIATAGWRGVIHRDGVYYAELAVQGQSAPMHVALHGITSELQAAKAMEALLGLQLPPFATAKN
ncbi:MAG: hypothetical protein ACO1QB_01705 [Verrucomicrobiales bacterium]